MEVEEDGSANGEIAQSKTVYVRNINERVKIPALIEALRGIFAEYGNIQDIVAKASLKRKGQAFIVYDDVESAQNAIDEINGFEIFGQQLSCDFAKTKSDSTVKAEEGAAAFEAHKQARLAEKERKQAAEASTLAESQSKKRGMDEEDLAERPAKIVKTSVATSKDVPDEYLPPNKTLTVRGGECTGEDLAATFGGFAGYREARTVPGRPLAFVEFEDADLAAAAKVASAGLVIGGQSLIVAFRRA